MTDTRTPLIPDPYTIGENGAACNVSMVVPLAIDDDGSDVIEGIMYRDGVVRRPVIPGLTVLFFEDLGSHSYSVSFEDSVTGKFGPISDTYNAICQEEATNTPPYADPNDPGSFDGRTVNLTQPCVVNDITTPSAIDPDGSPVEIGYLYRNGVKGSPIVPNGTTGFGEVVGTTVHTIRYEDSVTGELGPDSDSITIICN